MKKFTITLLILTILGLNFGFAAETGVVVKQQEKTVVKDHNLFDKIGTFFKAKVDNLKSKVANFVEKVTGKSIAAGLTTIVVIILIGLILLILGRWVHEIVSVIGAVLLIIGLILLVLELM